MAKNNRSNNNIGFAVDIIKLHRRIEDFSRAVTFETRKIVVEELLKETPVDTGFMRNHVTMVADPSYAVEIPSEARTPETIGSLKHQGLSYQQQPTEEEINDVLGIFKNTFPHLGDTYAVIPVEYAQYLVDNPKYGDFQMKAAKKAQVRCDETVMELYKLA